MKKVLFLCLGNICRSPMAAGILLDEATKMGLQVEADSAGFESFHIGDHPDNRATEACKHHGIDISQHRARLFHEADYENFDLIFAMDHKNFKDAKFFSRNEDDKKKLFYLMDLIHPGKRESVSDPYLAEAEECGKIFHTLRLASQKILETIQKEKVS